MDYLNVISLIISGTIVAVLIINSVRTGRQERARDVKDNIQNVINELREVSRSQKDIEIRVGKMETILEQLVKDVVEIRKQQNATGMEVEYLKRGKEKTEISTQMLIAFQQDKSNALVRGEENLPSPKNKNK